MADAPPKKPPPEGSLLAAVPATWRRVAIGAGVAIVAVCAWLVYRGVSSGIDEGLWEELAQIQSAAGDDASTHAWASAPADAVDVRARDVYIARLEEFLAKRKPTGTLAAQVHAALFGLEWTQIVGAGGEEAPDDVRRRYDRAAKHLEAIRDQVPDFPMNWEAFRPTDAPSITRHLLDVLRKNREWDEQHRWKPVTPDDDVVVLVRTSQGDLRLRTYASASPALVREFVDRACRGALDGTLIHAHDEGLEGRHRFLRGGDPRTRKTDATDDDRLSWGTPGPVDPLTPGSGRHRVLHKKGVVSAWHEDSATADDPEQFLVVTADSPNLDYEYTPFARVDEATFPTLDRIAALATRRREKPDVIEDPKYSGLQDHLVKPVTVVKTLVYERGALKSCHDATSVRESEKSLKDVVPDEDRKKDDPPAPPAGTPPAPPGGPPPKPPDGAPMDDGTGMGSTRGDRG